MARAAPCGLRRLLLPGSVALASDTAGFVTSALIDVPVIQEIALAASLGDAAIILTDLGLLPVLLSYAAPGGGGASALLLILGAVHAPAVRIGDQHRGVPELRANATCNRDTAAQSPRVSIPAWTSSPSSGKPGRKAVSTTA